MQYNGETEDQVVEDEPAQFIKNIVPQTNIHRNELLKYYKILFENIILPSKPTFYIFDLEESKIRWNFLFDHTTGQV